MAVWRVCQKAEMRAETTAAMMAEWTAVTRATQMDALWVVKKVAPMAVRKVG